MVQPEKPKEKPTWSEEQRIAVLRGYSILDTPKEPDFDDIVHLASEVCGTPISIINLIDSTRQWFKAEMGFGVRERPLDNSICKDAILHNEIFIIPDITNDDRFNSNPLVTSDPRLRFYAGALLENADGIPLGTLCVLDYKPRELSKEQLYSLCALARQVMTQLEFRRSLQEKKDLEIEARKAQQIAESANVAKTEFLANMSHEIRTPMNAIIGLSNILTMSKPLTPRQLEYVKTLQSSADSLLTLINDLLDISKIEARTVELEHIPFSIGRLTQEVVSMMAVQVKNKGLAFTGEGGSAEDKIFMGDPTRLRQIITNLCSNAIKFTDKGGVHISIHTTATGNPTVETVCIEVQDTGIGIAGDKLETIFNKFTQADASINRKYGGTGLGLTITKTLTEIMGGTITVKSEPAKGSTFTVCIPLIIATEQPKPVSTPTMAAVVESALEDKAKMKILLVEDYEANIMVASAFLEQFGFDVDVATNGQEAFDMCRNGNYIAALMDVQMHGINGLDATKMIRNFERQQNKRRLPIIGMTAHAMAGDRERCLGVDMDEYIAKPFNPDELREKIQSVTHQ